MLAGLLLAIPAALRTAAEAPVDPLARESLFQVSTLDALLAGLYDGVMDFASLSSRGNFGIGTIDRLDGEMIGCDGSFYRIDAQGRVHDVPAEETTPFACVTFFEPDLRCRLLRGTDYAALSDVLAELLPTANLFYAVRIEGTFSLVRTRSVPPQERPYRPLVEIVASQPVFEFHDVTGTLVGFRCPSFVSGLNVPGDHLHFLTEDRTGGGHVLELVIEDAQLTVDVTPTFVLVLPLGDDAFYTLDLDVDTQDATEAVENP